MNIVRRRRLPVWVTALGYGVLAGLVPAAVLWMLIAGASWFTIVTVLAVAVTLLFGNRRLFRTAVTRDADTIVCGFVPWYEGDVYRLIALFGVAGAWASVTAFTHRGAGMLSMIGFPLLAAVPLGVFALVRMSRWAMLRITPDALFVRTPGHGADVTEIRREDVVSVAPEVISRPRGASTWWVAVTHRAVSSSADGISTLPIGSVEFDCALWLSVGRLDVLEALLVWKDWCGKDAASGDRAALMDRIDAILRRRSRPETTAPALPAPPPALPEPAQSKPAQSEPAPEPPAPAPPQPPAATPPDVAAAYEYPALEKGPGPPRRSAWWRWIPVALAAVTLIGGVTVEDRAAQALEPPLDARFGVDQIAAVPLAAGETRTVYGEGAGRGAYRTADCAVRARTPGVEVRQQPADENAHVRGWNPLSTVTATRSGIVEVSCQGYPGSKFGVGAPIPPRRLLNGVAYSAGTAMGIVLVTLVFLLAAVLIVTVSRLDAARKRWINRFWAPLVLVAVVALSFNSVWDGVTVMAVWQAAAWAFRRFFTERR